MFKRSWILLDIRVARLVVLAGFVHSIQLRTVCDSNQVVPTSAYGNLVFLFAQLVPNQFDCKLHTPNCCSVFPVKSLRDPQFKHWGIGYTRNKKCGTKTVKQADTNPRLGMVKNTCRKTFAFLSRNIGILCSF